MEKLFGIILFLVGLFLFPVQFACLNATLKAGRYAKESPSWPTTTGRILTSECEKISPNRYIPKIIYKYYTDGMAWTSSTLAFDHGHADGLKINFTEGTLDQSWRDLEDAKEIIDRYPVDNEVTVYYDPEEHSRAVLIPGVKSGMAGDLTTCGFGFTISLSLLGVGIRLMRSDCSRVGTEPS